MKVLMVAPAKGIHAQRPLQWLLHSGCQVTLLDSFNPYPEGRQNYRFIPDLRVTGKKYYQKVLGKKFSHKLGLFLLALELRLCRRYLKPDITHIHWAEPERAFACVQAGFKPAILTVWGSDINELLKPGANQEHRRKVGRLLAGVDLTLVDAPDVAEKCCLLAGRQIPTLLLVLGIDTQLFQPQPLENIREWRRRLALPEDARVFLSVRALSPNYGHHLILEAFARARPSFHQESFLVFKLYNRPVSESDPEFSDFEQTLRRRVEEFGLGHCVRWIDQVDYEHMPGIYGMADVIVNFPIIDAFPVTFLEAAACRRPVITARLPAYAGTFAEKYFHLVESGNVDELAEAMVKFVNEPLGHDPIWSAARQVIIEEYDGTVTSKKLIAIYQETIAAGSRPRGPV